MKLKNIAILCLLLSTITAFSQSFEGQITYANTFKTKNTKITDQQWVAMLGSTQEYYIKGGDYKSITNGTFAQWQLYINKDNKFYNKMSNSEPPLLEVFSKILLRSRLLCECLRLRTHCYMPLQLATKNKSNKIIVKHAL